MSQKFIHDLLVYPNESTHIMVLQPAVTAGMRKLDDFSRLPGADFENRCCEVLENICLPSYFVHVANLQIRSELAGQQTSTQQPCGGFLEIDTDARGCVRIHCTECCTYADSRIKRHELPSILLHLLLKQLIPGLRLGNFVWTEELGTVGVLHDKLAVQTGRLLWRADLGLILMPGMHTLDGFNGFEAWAKLLFQAKFDQLQELNEAELSGMIGPKHTGTLNGGRRFWRS